MTVVYQYYRYLINSENQKTFLHFHESVPDELLICLPNRNLWEDMGNQSGSEVKEAEPRKHYGNEDHRPRKPSVDLESPFSHTSKHHLPIEDKFRKAEVGQLSKEPEKKDPKNCCCCCCSPLQCCKTLLIIVAVFVIIKALVAIAVSVSTAIAIQLYRNDIATRLMAMVLVAVISAIGLCMAIYAFISSIKNNSKALKIISIVVLVLAILLAIIIATAVPMTSDDETQLMNALDYSYNQARVDNQRHMKIWATTQNELKCCGLDGPEDFRPPQLPPMFSSPVPISCCPNYNPTRSDLVQEKEKEFCRSRKTYYPNGCRHPVMELFKETASLVMGFAITLDILLFAMSALAGLMSKMLSDGETKKSKK